MWWGQLTPTLWTSYSPLLSLDDAIDDAARIDCQCGFCGLIRRGSTDDGAGALLVARRDLTDLL